MIHKRELYSRVMKTEDIRLEDIQQLITCVSDKTEELIARLINKCEIKPGSGLNESVQSCIKSKEMSESASAVDDGDPDVADTCNTVRTARIKKSRWSD